MDEIKAYKPSCCPKAYIHKGSAIRHEKKCFKNSNNKACLSCGNFKTDTNTIYMRPTDGNYGDSDYEEKYFYCEYDDFILGEHIENGNNKSFQRDCKYWIPKVGD